MSGSQRADIWPPIDRCVFGCKGTLDLSGVVKTKGPLSPGLDLLTVNLRMCFLKWLIMTGVEHCDECEGT